MPVGYLVTAVLVVLSALAALAPPRRPPALSISAYLLGMTFNEMPLLAAAGAIAVVILSVADGGAGSPLGLAATGLMALGLAGLLLAGWRAVRSSTVPLSALDTHLGAGWRDALVPGFLPARGRGVVARGLFLPFLRRSRAVRRIGNLSYGDGGKSTTLDLYLPRKRPAEGPVLVHFHGGRFVSGRKNRESLYLLHFLAAHGWTCVSANYRLQPHARFPDYVVDAKRVLTWARSEGPGYGGGRGPVFIAGNSAGGFLAAFTALTPGRRDLQPGFEDADTSVSGAVCLYGYYGRVDGGNPDSTPAAHVNAGAPPFLVLHGTRDTVVPVSHGRRFAAGLAAASKQPVIWCELPDAQHSFDYFASVRARAAAEAIEAFAAWVRLRQAESGK